MKFKLNQLTALLLLAPFSTHAGLLISGVNSPSNTLSNTPDKQVHNLNGTLTIGAGGTTTPLGEGQGGLNIYDGTVLNLVGGNMYIGNSNSDGYSGEVTVTDPGSQLNIDGTLNIGNYSSGYLHIANGGKVTSTAVGAEPDPHFWGWFLHNAQNRTLISTNIHVEGENSELSYTKTSTIRVAGGGHKNTYVNLMLENGGKLSAGVLQLERGTTTIRIGNKGKAGILDVDEFRIYPHNEISFTFDQTDNFSFTPKIITASSAASQQVNFLQSGSGTTLFAPTDMSNTNAVVTIEDGTFKIGRDGLSVTSVDNASTLDLSSDNVDQTLVVRGNYNANYLDYKNNTPKLVVNTNGTSSDALDIQGTATGHTLVSTPTGFIYDKFPNQYSADVIKVADANHTGTFTGTAKTTSAIETQLTRKDANTYAWTQKVAGHDIYIVPASAYIQMPRVNMELGYSVLDTLHQRRGEVSQSPNSSVWARVSGKRLETEGRTRLDVDSSQYIAQVGYDFNRSELQGGAPQSLSGVYFAYSRSDSRFYDQYRAENGMISTDKYTGKGKSVAANVGVYHLYRAENDSYLDTVGQFSYLTNKYNLDREIRQHGWSGAVSIEGGHSFTLADSDWRLEPQAQLVYQHLKLQSFYDEERNIDVAQGSDNNLRGRLGVRLSHSKDFQRNPTAYFVANVWHDFVTAKSVLIGDTKYSENYARTWAEAGAGLNVPFGNQAIYADIRFEHALGNKGDRSGTKATLGYSYSW